MGKPMEFSAAEREQAAEQLGRLGWGDEYWDSWCTADQDAEIRRIANGSGILIPASRLIERQCQLNAAVELLREGRQGHLERELPCEIDPGNLVLTPIDDRCTWCQDTDDFLSHFPEGAKQ